jgi:hypothetical protein
VEAEERNRRQSGPLDRIECPQGESLGCHAISERLRRIGLGVMFQGAGFIEREFGLQDAAGKE